MSQLDDKTTVGHVAEKVDSTAMGHGAAEGTNAAIHNEHNMSVRQTLRFWNPVVDTFGIQDGELFTDPP